MWWERKIRLWCLCGPDRRSHVINKIYPSFEPHLKLLLFSGSALTGGNGFFLWIVKQFSCNSFMALIIFCLEPYVWMLCLNYENLNWRRNEWEYVRQRLLPSLTQYFFHIINSECMKLCVIALIRLTLKNVYYSMG